MAKKKYIIPLLALITIAGLCFYGAIPQNENYHHFADQRNILGVPNFLNVITNLPFVIIAIIGLYAIRGIESNIKVIAAVLFISFLLLTFGSGYYHLHPNNVTLVYDRIPIVIVIISFFSLIIEDHIHPRRSLLLFSVLNIIGISTVLYWAFTENAGKGDLRWYAMAQFFPIIAVPIILWLYKSAFSYRKEILFIYLSFILAKVTEIYDKEIYLLFAKLVSGHSLKHLLMAVSGYGIILLIRKRNKSIHISASSTQHNEIV